MPVRSQEEWQRILVEYRASTETVSAFCKRHLVTSGALYYHLAKKGIKPKSAPILLPVVSPKPAISESVELSISRGMVLRFSPGASADYVAGIIRALV